ncbi:hypothetical protein [Microcoleus sp. N9_A1]|uniref:hypothetical protein n=1 Tax=Microcoleus sp. N9_A1 TaxID=3055380 RepID=UPI002FD77DEC
MRDCINFHSRSHKLDLSLSRTLLPNQSETIRFNLNYQLGISNYQLAITNYQLPITNCQPSTVNRQLSTVNYLFSASRAATASSG